MLSNSEFKVSKIKEICTYILVLIRDISDWKWQIRKYFNLHGFRRQKDLMIVSTQVDNQWANIVLCFQNCSDLLWEKVFSSDREKLLKLEAEDQEFAKFLGFEIPKTIYSNSKSLIQFECFFNLFLEVSQIQYVRTIKFKSEKIVES